MRLNELSRRKLADVMNEYDKYIQAANESDRYEEGWKPVCIEEFYNNEYQQILDERDDPDKLIITLDGGIIQDVLCTTKNIDIMVVDFDYEGADENEFWQPGEIEDFADERYFYDKNLKCGVYDHDLPIEVIR